MTLKTSDHSRSPLGLSPVHWALIAAIVFGSVAGALAITFALDDRDAARAEAGAIAGQSQELAACVRDPATDDCEEEAVEVEKTIEDAADVVPVPGPSGPPGPAGSDGLDGLDGLDGEDGQRGARGPRGLRGFIGPVGPDGIPGLDGLDGAVGATGAAGPPGEPGARGPDGTPGAAGEDGAPGQDGRGVRSVSCDPDSERFVVTYTDGTSEPVEGSDCVAGPDPFVP